VADSAPRTALKEFAKGDYLFYIRAEIQGGGSAVSIEEKHKGQEIEASNLIAFRYVTEKTITIIWLKSISK
jgi:hypothetical protein